MSRKPIFTFAAALIALALTSAESTAATLAADPAPLAATSPPAPTTLMSEVPETDEAAPPAAAPAAMGMLGIGFSGMIALRRRLRKFFV